MMFCNRCYAPLDGAENPWCPRCGTAFDPRDPKTFLDRPFPRRGAIVRHIVLTTVIGVLVAFVVALHQAARTSGH